MEDPSESLIDDNPSPESSNNSSNSPVYEADPRKHYEVWSKVNFLTLKFHQILILIKNKRTFGAKRVTYRRWDNV